MTDSAPIRRWRQRLVAVVAPASAPPGRQERSVLSGILTRTGRPRCFYGRGSWSFGNIAAARSISSSVGIWVDRLPSGLRRLIGDRCVFVIYSFSFLGPTFGWSPIVGPESLTRCDHSIEGDNVVHIGFVAGDQRIGDGTSVRCETAKGPECPALFQSVTTRQDSIASPHRRAAGAGDCRFAC